MESDLVLNSREPDLWLGCMNASSLLPVGARCSVEAHLWDVSATEKLSASVDVRPLIRSTSFGMCARGNVNASDSLPNWNIQENESERVKEAENWGGCEKLVHGGVPLRKMLQSKEQYTNVIVDVNGNLVGANENKSVYLNVSESGILGFGNENVSD